MTAARNVQIVIAALFCGLATSACGVDDLAAAGLSGDQAALVVDNDIDLEAVLSGPDSEKRPHASGSVHLEIGWLADKNDGDPDGNPSDGDPDGNPSEGTGSPDDPEEDGSHDDATDGGDASDGDPDGNPSRPTALNRSQVQALSSDLKIDTDNR